MDKLKIGLSKQSLKDLKVSTSAMTRVEKDIIVLKSVKFGVFQFLNYTLYHQDDCNKCVVMVVRLRNLWNKTTREVQFYLTSLENARKLGQAIRLHWGIENVCID